jgi:hypothetical protein
MCALSGPPALRDKLSGIVVCFPDTAQVRAKVRQHPYCEVSERKWPKVLQSPQLTPFLRGEDISSEFQEYPSLPIVLRVTNEGLLYQGHKEDSEAWIIDRR